MTYFQLSAKISAHMVFLHEVSQPVNCPVIGSSPNRFLNTIRYQRGWKICQCYGSSFRLCVSLLVFISAQGFLVQLQDKQVSQSHRVTESQSHRVTESQSHRYLFFSLVAITTEPKNTVCLKGHVQLFN